MTQFYSKYFYSLKKWDAPITREQVNYYKTVGETTTVGKYPPNAFGLYDMHGNVWEWCQDDWHDNYENAPNDDKEWGSGKSNKKVIRSCSWDYDPHVCRSACRYDSARDARDLSIGFRVVRVAPRTT